MTRRNRPPLYTIFALACVVILIILPIVWVGPMGRTIHPDEWRVLNHVLVLTVAVKCPLCVLLDWLERRYA